MKFDILTIFPHILDSYVNESIIGRARTRALVEVNFRDIREYTFDKHRTVDDSPYGGGPGMILKIEPIFKCLVDLMGSEEIEDRVRKHESRSSNQGSRIMLLSPQGELLTQKKAQEFTHHKHLILICGRYEGIHARIKNFIDEEISIGQYVLSGGELPAMIVVEAVTRLLPGVLGSADSLIVESYTTGSNEVGLHSGHVVEYPQYTRPEVLEPISGVTWRVPEVLLSGDHKEILKWRKEHITKI